MTETRTITATLTEGEYGAIGEAFAIYENVAGEEHLPDEAGTADAELIRAWVAAGPSEYPVRDAASRLRRLEAEHGRPGDPLEDIFGPAVRSLLLEDPDADQEELTRLALDYSLCPLHLVDYAICFDDETAECAAIRMIHPCHDT